MAFPWAVSSATRREELASASREQARWRKKPAPRRKRRQWRHGPPALPWTVRLQIFGLVTATDIAQRADGMVNRFVFSLADRQAYASACPDRLGVVSADIAAEPSAAIPVPLVVYVHGGDVALFSAASAPYDAMYHRFCRELGAVVMFVNYRLAPEHRYPTAYDDRTDVLWFLVNGGLPDGELAVSVDLSRCFLTVDSASGNIVHHMARRWTVAGTAFGDLVAVRIAGIILLQPYFGGEEGTAAELRLEGVAPVVNIRRSNWSWRAFHPEGATRDHPAAHVTVTEPELGEAFPPALVVIDGLDPLQDWQRRYAEMPRQEGKYVQVVEFTESIHAFYIFPEFTNTRKVVKRIKAFMDENYVEFDSL
ncbi:unnamed protein product [Miscanthus lutarioriparius]|uniref:Alpha/beta hydrolase fold-3 domain-containing protein n=1 Tax=Miscanthus lutarioriparius TaxID=422564 RepID=A0A811SKD5_9POAL|nr:unnamed protein product [Miscanthus lutarioriparius]